MSDQKFKVQLSGEVIDGHAREEVVVALARIFKVNPQRAEALLSGKPTTINREFDRAPAEALCRQLQEGGALCSIIDLAPQVDEDYEATVIMQPKQNLHAEPIASLKAAPVQHVISKNHHSGASLEKGLAGDYEINTTGIIAEAWKRIAGHKGRIWIGLIALILASQLPTILIALAGFDDTTPTGLGLTVFAGVLQLFLAAPITAGLFIYCARVASDQSVELADIFTYFPGIITLGLLDILFNALVILGFVLLVIPGVYLMVAYSLALPLQADKRLGIWQSLESSRRALTRHWFYAFGLMIVAGLLVVIGSLLVGIGLIWALPMVFMCYGILYREVFGIEPNAV